MFRPRLLRIPRLSQSVLATATSQQAAGQPHLLPLAARQIIAQQQSRSQHTLPTLPKEAQLRNGVPDLLSAGTVELAWFEYQEMMLRKLNALAAETEWETKDIKNIVLGTARDPMMAPVFNHASMAHNNEFFFSTLRLSEKPVPIPAALKEHLETSFGSIETLRREMVYTAAAMFGPGFVWLCRVDETGNPNSYKILTTYLAGSPYPGAHWRRQGGDMNTVGANSDAGVIAGRSYLDRTTYGATVTGRKADAVSDAPGGVNLTPVLCINTWEHVWLRDYGLGVKDRRGGKLGYAEAWWNAIDWEKVAERAGLIKK